MVGQSPRLKTRADWNPVFSPEFPVERLKTADFLFFWVMRRFRYRNPFHPSSREFFLPLHRG